jgi:hypothetical protein
VPRPAHDVDMAVSHGVEASGIKSNAQLANSVRARWLLPGGREGRSREPPSSRADRRFARPQIAMLEALLGAAL